MVGNRKEPGILLGALSGAVLAAPLMALLALGKILLDRPFVPFDIFDGISRLLPGQVVTFGIDSLVKAIQALGFGAISRAAKHAERALALGGFLLSGAVFGAFLFVIFRRWRPDAGPKTGFAAGVVAGIPALPFSWVINQHGLAGTVFDTIGILALFGAWGAALGHAFRSLRGNAPPAANPTAQTPSGSATAVDRRTFLIRLGGAAAAVTVTGAWVATLLASKQEEESARGNPWSSAHPLPNADAGVEPVRGTRPELTPVGDHYRIDINARAPRIREDQWRLRLHGMVEAAKEWSLEDLRGRYQPLHQFVTLACISNPIAGGLIGTQRWTGVPLRNLLKEVKPRTEAGHLTLRARDGFHESLPLAEALEDERIMLTYAWDGLPLTHEHGFPLRIYRPDRYGMKQPKWLESIELTDHEVEGYWVRRGWDREARMRAATVIDTVGVDMMIAEAGHGTLVPIGGMAHAGARGISKVEVRVDGGPWREAKLRTPLSDRTWVLWRYDWPFQAGEHAFTVRCADGKGQAQIEDRAPIHPSGATGYHSKDIML